MATQKFTRGKIFVDNSPVHRYGVFADQHFRLGDVIEECLLLRYETRLPELINYDYDLLDGSGIALGCGSLYNHSNKPNAKYFIDKERGIIVFRAIRPIKKREEIFSNYGDGWFEDRDMLEVSPITAKVKTTSAILISIARFLFVAGALLFILKLIQP